MLNHILLPLDGSQLAECTLRHAATLAHAFGARLTLTQVLENPHAGQIQVVDPMNWHISRVEAQAYLAETAEQFSALGITAQVVLLEGQAADRVIEYAHEHAVDLVLLSSHGRSGLTGWNVSSTVQKIVLRISRPVMIVPAYESAPGALDNLRYRKLLLALDGTPRAECVLPWAGYLAAKHEASLLLTHIVRPPDMPRRAPLTAEERHLLDQIMERNQEAGIKYLEQVKARLPGQVETRLITSSSVAAALHELSEQEHTDLVMLNAHCYSADTRWPYGSEVATCVTYGNVPLLIMPDVPSETLEHSKAETAAEMYGSR